MKYKEFYVIIFAFIFIFLAKMLSNYIARTNYVDPYQDIDSKGYIYNAEKFYKFNKFVLKDDDKQAPYFSLGYPVFIGVIYKIFGPKNNAVIWLQILLTLLTCFLIFSISSLIWGQNVGIIAFILSCLNVGFITFSNFILTESLLLLLLTSFLYFFILFLYKYNYKYLVLSGFILGISIWVKPAAIYFIFLVLILLACLRQASVIPEHDPGSSQINKLKTIILFMLAFYLPVIAYAYFNKINYGQYTVTSIKDEAIYFYLLPKVLAIQNNSSERIEQRNIAKLISGNKIDPKSWDKVRNLFNKNLTQNYFLFIKIWCKNVLKTFLGLYSTNLKVLINKNLIGGELSFFKIKGNFLSRIINYIKSGTDLLSIKAIAVLEALWSLLRIFLIFAALIFLLIKRKYKIFLFLFFYILYFAFITGHDGCARFRIMFEPVLIILAAQGLYMLYFRLKYKSCPLGEL